MNNSRFWTSGDIGRWCAVLLCMLTMHWTTHRLFFVAFCASCWPPGGPDPAAEALYARRPSDVPEPWPQLHRQVCHFSTFEILSPQSWVQTVSVRNNIKWIVANNVKTSQSRSGGLLVPQGPARPPWIHRHLLDVAQSRRELHLGQPESFHCFPCRIPSGRQRTSSLENKSVETNKQTHFPSDLPVIPTSN